MKLDQTPIAPTEPAIDSAGTELDVGLVDAGAFAAFLSSLEVVGEALPADSLILPTELLDPELAALEKAAAGEVAVLPVEVLPLAAENVEFLSVPEALPLLSDPKAAPILDVVSQLEPSNAAVATTKRTESLDVAVLAKAIDVDVAPQAVSALEELPFEEHEEHGADMAETLEAAGVSDLSQSPVELPANLPSAADLALANKHEQPLNGRAKTLASDSAAIVSSDTSKHRSSNVAATTSPKGESDLSVAPTQEGTGGADGASLASEPEPAERLKSDENGRNSESKGDSGFAQRAMEIARASRGLPEPEPLTVATEGKPNEKLATLDTSLAEAPASPVEAHREMIGRAKLRFGEAEPQNVRLERPATVAPEDVSASDLAARSRDVRRDVLREKLGAPKSSLSPVPEARFAVPVVAVSIESATKHAESKAIDAEVRQVVSGEVMSSELRLGEERNREERNEELAGSPEVAQADALTERPVLEVGDAIPVAFDSRDRPTAAVSPLGKGFGIHAENGVQGFFGLHSSESVNEASPVYVQQRLVRTAEAEVDHPELGRIDLSMRAEAGGVSVKASTRSEIAAAVLSANEGSLRRTSNDRGLAIKNFKVALMNDVSSSEEKSRAAGASRGLLNTEA